MTTGISAGGNNAAALVRQQRGLSFSGPVTAATSTTVMVIGSLAGFGNDYFVGWWAYVLWDAGGASAAPQGEWRLVTDYVSSTGTFTHNAFTAQTALTDIILLVHPAIHEPISLRGGAATLQSLTNHDQADLDFARVETAASPMTLAAASQATAYQRIAGSRPFFFCGGFFSWDSGDPGVDAVTVNVNTRTDGTNWVNMWTITLAALPSPLELAVPSHANSALLNIPFGFWVMAGNGVQVTIGKDADAGGDHVVSHSFGDGAPGN